MVGKVYTENEYIKLDVYKEGFCKRNSLRKKKKNFLKTLKIERYKVVVERNLINR